MIVRLFVVNVNILIPSFALASLFFKDLLIEKIIREPEKRFIFAP